jgi:hypothetical protein
VAVLIAAGVLLAFKITHFSLHRIHLPWAGNGVFTKILLPYGLRCAIASIFSSATRDSNAH